MNTAWHDVQMLGAYVLGTLEPREVTAVDAHVVTCPECRNELEELRAMKESLGDLPPEALLDGPPEGSDLALQRTLRQVRSERTSMRRRRGLVLVGAAALAAAVLAGGGFVAGQAVLPSSEEPEVVELASEGVLASEENPETGARATVMLQPAGDAESVQVDSVVTGIPEGEQCEVVVVSKDGSSEVATSWIVSAEAASKASEPGGSVVIPPEEVASVMVRNVNDTEFVTVPF